MAGNMIAIQTSDGETISTYIADNQTDSPKPAILMFSAIFGVDDDMKALADLWADRGFLVAVPDYYFRVNPGVIGRSEEERKKALERWKALDVDAAMADMTAVSEHLKASPGCNGKIGALGYCAGGELAFLSATRLGAVAVAIFHGTHIDKHMDEADRIAGQASLHFGGDDPLVPMTQVEVIKEKLATSPRVSVHVYPGAGHGFSFAGRPSYHEVAAVESDRAALSVMESMADV